MTKTITVHVPMRLATRGGRKTIVSETKHLQTSPRLENALLKALVKAYSWRRQIESGDYSSITELAKAHQVNDSYACRLLRLTLLAPSIVTDILDGTQSSDLTLKNLMRPLPTRWDEQIVALGVSSETANA